MALSCRRSPLFRATFVHPPHRRARSFLAVMFCLSPPSFPQKRESIFAVVRKVKADSRFRGNDAPEGSPATDAQPPMGEFHTPQSGSATNPIAFCIRPISGLAMNARHTSPVRPFSIITACGAWLSPMVMPEYQFACSLNESRKP